MQRIRLHIPLSIAIICTRGNKCHESTIFIAIEINKPPFRYIFDTSTCSIDLLIFKLCLDGNWGSWNSWTMCTVSCGGGVRNRTRNCDNPVLSDAGKDCMNNDSEQGACYTQNCPIRKFALH